MQPYLQVMLPDAESVLTTTPPMDDDQFFEFCAQNSDVQIERTAQGEIIIMPLTGGETSNRNMEMSGQLRDWARRDGRGRAFDSSGGFLLPNGAVRGPDAAWGRNSWLETLPRQRKRRFLPLCPDFVIELVSPSDRRSKVVAKMQEWIENGAELAWMIDPDTRIVTIFRHGREAEELVNPEFIQGEGPVEGFRLELAEIWAGL